MKMLFFLVCLIVVSFLASPARVEAQVKTKARSSSSSSAPEMSPEKVLDYFVATYLNGGGLMANLINVYGKVVDPKKHERVMADKYERERYIAQIWAKMEDKAARMDFDKKFSIVVEAKLGKYSYENHSFPVFDRGEVVETLGELSSGGSLFVRGFDTKRAVNGADFSWSLPMSSDNDANALIKSMEIRRRSLVNRQEEFHPVVVRLTYSVVNNQGALSLTTVDGFPASRYVLSLFIHSAEVFTDHKLTKKLGTIPKIVR